MTGWGQALQALLPDGVYVENCAVNGRSSKSFVAERRLNYVELCLRRGDKLLISFGHNDEKEDVLRHTDPYTTYQEYLSMYIDAARRQGAEPVLLTSIVRRSFDEQGRLRPTHGAYPQAMRTLADWRGVRLIDLERATAALVQAAGEEGSRAIYCHVPAGHPNYPEGVADNSHLQFNGAAQIAQLALRLLQGGADVPMAELAEQRFETVDVRAGLNALLTEEDARC